MNIGIYGGAFNPIHIGHLILAQSSMEEYNLDKVLFIVSLNPPHKVQGTMPSFEHRCAMVELAIKDKKEFEISLIEKEIEGKSYTYYVLQKLKEIYKNDNFYLIIGEDEANYFNSWFKYEEIMKMCKVIVGHRDTTLPANNLEFNYVKTPNIQISSSEMRKKIKDNKSILFWTSKEVVDYINKNDIYN